MEKILSLSIAAYNAEKDIANCLDSLINSNVLDQLDVIVVNDGSKDHTAEIVQTYTEKYGESIRLVNKKNGGHGSTINTSIKYACGKYYKILDSDDWVDSENLSRLVTFLKKTDVDMVLNPYDEIAYDTKMKTRQLNPFEKDIAYEEVHKLDDFDKAILYMHSLTFRREVIMKMGSIIDENCFYVDMEYCIFPLLYVKTFACLDYPVYEYLLGSQTQSMNMANMIKRRDQHLKVTRRLVSFYKIYVNDLNIKVRENIALRIKYAIYNQYVIYLNMTPREAVSEIKEFDEWLKKQSRELYDGPDGMIMKYIKINRKIGYRLFVPVTDFLKRIRIIK